jgi:ribosome-interacting GTPase 1
MGILEKVAEIEKEIARTQKNKGKTRELCSNRIRRSFKLAIVDSYCACGIC